MQAEIELSRDCEAIQIPQGTTVTLPAGTRVTVTQSLGGSYTVASEAGYLFRITEANADAIGCEAKTCYDPEIPVNIVDLGLIYDCAIVRQESGKARVSVKMTLTAPGCGMGPTIAAEARMRVESIPGVAEANVELVWDPPWDQSMISEAGKMKLGLI
ncbi:MAG: iron-sulfur cluster assembly protein [Verrucomicrobia bacterium]|nr:iron-sulfur cluster assembly protein [Verrucomicrobiota bacterium]